MNRRTFAKRLPVITTSLAAGVASLAAAACGGVSYLVPRVHPAGFLVPVSVLAEEGQALVKAPDMPRAVLVRLTDGDPIALLASCTHQGCQPDLIGDRMICPCHGSEFSLDGEVLQGPASQPLTRFEVSRSGPDWVVHYDRAAR